MIQTLLHNWKSYLLPLAYIDNIHLIMNLTHALKDITQLERPHLTTATAALKDTTQLERPHLTTATAAAEIDFNVGTMLSEMHSFVAYVDYYYYYGCCYDDDIIAYNDFVCSFESNESVNSNSLGNNDCNNNDICINKHTKLYMKLCQDIIQNCPQRLSIELIKCYLKYMYLLITKPPTDTNITSSTSINTDNSDNNNNRNNNNDSSNDGSTNNSNTVTNHICNNNKNIKTEALSRLVVENQVGRLIYHQSSILDDTLPLRHQLSKYNFWYASLSLSNIDIILYENDNYFEKCIRSYIQLKSDILFIFIDQYFLLN